MPSALSYLSLFFYLLRQKLLMSRGPKGRSIASSSTDESGRKHRGLRGPEAGRRRGQLEGLGYLWIFMG